LINILGFILVKKEENAFKDLRQFFDNHGEPLIIFDIGSNKGEIISEFHKIFRKATIHSFEAIPDLFNYQKAKFSGYSKTVFNQVVVSDRTGSVDFYINNFEDTSSILPKNADVVPDRYGNVLDIKEVIKVRSISLNEYVIKSKIDNVDLIKMDIQGAELMALKGASELLEKGMIKVLYLETMFIPLYSEQPLFNDITSFLIKHNYSLVYIYNVQFNFKTGRLLQCDSVFVHNSLKNLYPKISL